MSNTTLYFLSCDGQDCKKWGYSNPFKYYNVTDDTDMWKKLYQDIQSDNNPHKYVIHLGDQLYMDDVNDEILKDEITEQSQIEQLYIDFYIKNYSKTYKQLVLKSAYNIMICDDHEYDDNFASVDDRINDRMKIVLNNITILLQEKLYSYDTHNIKYIKLSDCQIIMPNLRKYRQKNTSTYKYPILGETQFNELSELVTNTKEEEILSFYVSTIPLVSLNYLLLKIGRLIDEGVFHDDYIVSESYYNEQKLTFELISQLRKLIIVAGDYHYGEHTIISNDHKVIHQFITSPISSDIAIKEGDNAVLNYIKDKMNKYLYQRSITDFCIEKQKRIFDYNYLRVRSNDISLQCFQNENNYNVNIFSTLLFPKRFSLFSICC